MDTLAAAWGIHRLVNENMASAARIHAIERGRDIRGHSLFAFGGAGPVHACHVAEILGLEQVIVPPGAGVASAFGMLTAPLSFSVVRSHSRRLAELDWNEAGALLGEMVEEGLAMLERSQVPRPSARVEVLADMRYQGQTSEIPVPLPAPPLTSASLPAIVERFEETYRTLYQRLNRGMPIETVTWRVTVSGPNPGVPAWTVRTDASGGAATPKTERPVYLRGAYRALPVYDRSRLAPATRVAGPAIVEERESTVVITEAFDVHVDEQLNVVLRRRTS
jgi:N-methylhydantoinase A